MVVHTETPDDGDDDDGVGYDCAWWFIAFEVIWLCQVDRLWCMLSSNLSSFFFSFRSGSSGSRASVAAAASTAAASGWTWEERNVDL